MNYLLPVIYKIPFLPPLLNPNFIRKFADTQTLALDDPLPESDKSSFPDHSIHRSRADFARGQIDEHNRSIPQLIAHRGYSSKYDENSIQSFDQAIKAGAHAIETDLHLTKDGVIVLSHDPDLRRCFSVDKRVGDCDWDLLKTFSTTSKSPQPLATLSGLLELLVKSEADSVWLLLDIKMNDDPDDLFRAISSTLQGVKPRPGRPWTDRVMLGYWTTKYLSACQRYLPEFPVASIGFHIPYVSQFLPVPDASFVTFMPSLVSPYGRQFMRKSKSLGKPVIAWSVDDPTSIEWCFDQGLDGVLLTDMLQYYEARKRYGHASSHRFSIKMICTFIMLNFWIYIFGLLVSLEARARRPRAKAR